MAPSGTDYTSFVWLVNDSSSPVTDGPKNSKHSKNLIRSNAAAWGHQTRRRKHRPLGRDHKGRLAPRAPRIQVKVRAPEVKNKKDVYSLAAPPLPPSPSMLQDELFGRQMDHVLVRFHAIAGSQNLEWLNLVATVRDDELVHSTFKALICGLDSTTTPAARRHRCAEILPAIRQRLVSPGATRSLNMIHLVFLLSYQELLVWNNPKAWLMHIWGLSTIVQTLGPHAFRGILELRTLKQIRLFNVPLNLFLRRRSFLESPEWLEVPWAYGQAKDLLDLAVDSMVFIPGLMAESDRVRVEGATMNRLHIGVSRLKEALDLWRFRSLVQHCISWHNRLVDVECIIQELSDGILVDALIAQAVVIHLATCLLLTRLEPVYSASLPWPAEFIAESILDICEEYSYRQMANGVLPWTTAIRVALFTPLKNADAIKSRGRNLCVRVEARYSVRMLSDIIASLPGSSEAPLKFDD